MLRLLAAAATFASTAASAQPASFVDAARLCAAAVVKPAFDDAALLKAGWKSGPLPGWYAPTPGRSNYVSPDGTTVLSFSAPKLFPMVGMCSIDARTSDAGDIATLAPLAAQGAGLPPIDAQAGAMIGAGKGEYFYGRAGLTMAVTKKKMKGSSVVDAMLMAKGQR